MIVKSWEINTARLLRFFEDGARLALKPSATHMRGTNIYICSEVCHFGD